MASTHQDDRYDNLRAAITTHTGKQLQLGTPTLDKNLALVCANVDEYLAKQYPHLTDPQEVFCQVAGTLHRLLVLLQQAVGTPTAPTVSTLDLLRVFVNSKQAKSDATMKQSLDQFEICFGKRAHNPPTLFTYAHMREYIASMISRGYDPSTAMSRLSVLRDFFSEMVVRKFCFENPAEGVQLTTQQRRLRGNRETLPLEEAEVLAIFQAMARDNKLQLAGTLIVRECCSCRPGQVAGLKWAQYNCDENGPGFDMPAVKGGVPRRMPATQQAVEFLDAWREKCPNIGPTDPIFPEYYDDDPVKRKSKAQKMSVEFHEAMLAAGIDRVRYDKVLSPGATDQRKTKRCDYGKRGYSLRHLTFARVAPEFGLAVAKEYLQHKLVSTTLHYAKAQKQQLLEARDGLNKKVKGSLAEFERVQAAMFGHPALLTGGDYAGMPVDSLEAYECMLATLPDAEPPLSRLPIWAQGIPADSWAAYGEGMESWAEVLWFRGKPVLN